ncbi:MFS general substrate transporter [Mucor ambiguus]|uniref:MFS general substrate transporter n=1 Tax=Mucor ambiguus TaxID=91626 RepID=A0A0C9MT88_9FUNG|nr:MFS general substrate transporter [Mucor ambiguus]
MNKPHSVFHEEKTAVEYEDVALGPINDAVSQQPPALMDTLQHTATIARSPSLLSIPIDEHGSMRKSLLLKNAFQIGTPYDDLNTAADAGKSRQHLSSTCCHGQVMRYIKTKMAFKVKVADDPRLFSPSEKRFILAALALGASLNGFCSTVYFPGIPDIKADLNASDIEITLVSSLFILFGGIGPIFWASVSDYYYIRRFLYLVALLIFIAASTGCALANSAPVLIVLRCIQSIGTSGVCAYVYFAKDAYLHNAVTMSVGAGTVADCWQMTERGSAFSFLFVGQFLGPLLGPIIGGGITTASGWRSVFWVCTGYGVFLFVFFFLFFPETYRLDHHWNQRLAELPSQSTLPVVAMATGDDDTSSRLDLPPLTATTSRTLTIITTATHQQGFNPLKSFVMLKYAFVCFVAIEIGFCFGTMFTLETLIPDLYFINYGFDSWQTGLSFIGAGLGNVLGSIVSGILSDYLLIRSSKQREGISKAEDRLTLNAWPGGFILIPLGVLLFGWSIMAGFSVWPAIIGFSTLCFGMSQVYTAGSAYLVDSIPGKGASVTAACNFFRMTMAAILSFISPIMGSALSIGYVCILLASLNILGMSLLVFIKLKGIHMRRQAGFAQAK